MAVDFCDYFWGEEHTGWNVLYQNMKQGHSASKELAEFFKERWMIDESYCKALIKLANKAGINSEKGTLAPLFTLLKNSSEKMSNVHLHMVNRVQDLVKDIGKYNEELHKKQKQVKDEESQTEDIVKNIQAISSLAQKAKETYSQRCQDLEKLKRDGASPKDVEKAETKLRKAHDEYKALVEKYNTTRDEFEKRMLQSCRRFQGVEETHLSQILLFVQTYIYLLQTDQNAMSQILQELMNKYSQFSIDKLLDSFALNKLTGLEKPVMMVFEDNSSLGSVVSGQQSPEPTDQSKSSADDASSLGEKASSGGVLAGGRVGDSGNSEGVCGVAKLSKKECTRSFSKSKVIAVSCGHKLDFAVDEMGSQEASGSQRIRPISYRRPAPVKGRHRTTSLLNIFVASSSAANHKSNAKVEDICSEGEVDSEKVNGALQSSTVISAPSSPTGIIEESSLGRSVFRSSKLSLSGSSPLLSFGFLRSRRDKKKDKKAKKKKETDTSSNKDEKSDNENSEEARTVDLLSMNTPLSIGKEDDEKNADGDILEDSFEHRESACDDTALSSSALSFNASNVQEELKVDEDGYTIKPQHLQKARLNNDNSFDSSSDSDSEIGIDKKIHVEIKPIANGTTPVAASVDELRATIEGMSLSPLGFSNPRKNTMENQENGTIRRSNSITQSIGSGSADLFGLNLSLTSPKYGGGGTASRDSQDGNIRKTSSPFSTLPLPAPLRSTPTNPVVDRYAELSEIMSDGNATPPVLPPRGSRGSTPTMALPRPARKGSASRSVPSPATVLSRTESISSLEFRTSTTLTGVSRGPSPLTIGMSDTIPLAVAFQELCHAYFRGTDESRIQMKVTGEMMVSFPAGIVGVLANNPNPSQLSFKVRNFNNVTNPLPNKLLVTYDEDQSDPDCGVYNFDMNALNSLLRKQADQNPSASYFNVDIIKYQVTKLCGAESSPLHMVAYWRCEDNHTDLRVDYRYNERAMGNPSPLLNINISVVVDGVVKNMQSKPTGQWVKDQQKAVWKITDLSKNSPDAGKGSLRGKFEVAAGPSTPATVTAQFNCEGTTLSGLEFALVGTGYRVSLVKKRFVSGKYICDADAVLRHRYGSVC